MMILTGSKDESQIYVLEDGSEIEITVIELEGNKAKVVICTGEHVSVIHKVAPSSY
jgi:sRNA-binding carbon storage regulator CsrA